MPGLMVSVGPPGGGIRSVTVPDGKPGFYAGHNGGGVSVGGGGLNSGGPQTGGLPRGFLDGLLGGSGGSGGGAVQTGFNANSQAVNTGSNMERFAKENNLGNMQLSGDGRRAAGDFEKAQQFSNASQLKRGMEAGNSQQSAADMMSRSQLLQTAMANQARIYSDMGQRQSSQIGLASNLQNSLLRHQRALSQSLTAAS